MAEEALLVLSEPSTLQDSSRVQPWLMRMLACAVTAIIAALLSVAPALAAPAPKKAPVWAELTAEQQQVLDPLKGEWDKMDRPRRIKWVGIAKRYPGMNPTGQRRVQTRMQNWAKLTPEQRSVARNSYRNTIVRLPPELKKDLRAHWQEYQALPDHEKRRLAAKPVEPLRATPPKRAKKSPETSGAAPYPSHPAYLDTH
ncbi:MAG: DUF3106 domain-containing protein [Betaproteobacteria bacterium]|nr:DUF3106 domain-containing protein [Betaproteobacteria bacterium]